jgi:hypothetical protein
MGPVDLVCCMVDMLFIGAPLGSNGFLQDQIMSVSALSGFGAMLSTLQLPSNFQLDSVIVVIRGRPVKLGSVGLVNGTLSRAMQSPWKHLS